MNPPYTQRILCSQSSLRGHGIAAMCGNDFLVGFETSIRELASHFGRRKRLGDLRSAITACASDHQYALHLSVYWYVPRMREGDNELLRFNGMMSWLLLMFVVKAYTSCKILKCQWRRVALKCSFASTILDNNKNESKVKISYLGLCPNSDLIDTPNLDHQIS